jgi:predicted  nucleic acid-binding Zn-ribbon protein
MIDMKMPVQVKLLLELHKLETNGGISRDGKIFRKIEEGLDQSLLKRYLKLRDRKGTGTAVLNEGMCSACRMVYPETHRILLYRNSIHTCEFCGRLLVVNGKAVQV